MKFFGLKMVCLLVIRVENDGGRKEDEEGQKKSFKKKRNWWTTRVKHVYFTTLYITGCSALGWK